MNKNSLLFGENSKMCKTIFKVVDIRIILS